MLVGVISDTHGILRSWVAPVFEAVDLIVHAGDVVDAMVITELELIAPVVAVHGNMDPPHLTAELPRRLRLDLDGVRVLVTHSPEDVPGMLHEGPVDVVITGHTHRPLIAQVKDHLAVNPGSASRPVGEGCSVALLRIEGGLPRAEIVRE